MEHARLVHISVLSRRSCSCIHSSFIHHTHAHPTGCACLLLPNVVKRPRRPVQGGTLQICHGVAPGYDGHHLRPVKAHAAEHGELHPTQKERACVLTQIVINWLRAYAQIQVLCKYHWRQHAQSPCAIASSRKRMQPVPRSSRPHQTAQALGTDHGARAYGVAGQHVRWISTQGIHTTWGKRQAWVAARRDGQQACACRRRCSIVQRSMEWS